MEKMNKLIVLILLFLLSACSGPEHPKPKFAQGDWVKIITDVEQPKDSNCTGQVVEYVQLNTLPDQYYVAVKSCWIRRNDGFIVHAKNEKVWISVTDVQELK